MPHFASRQLPAALAAVLSTALACTLPSSAHAQQSSSPGLSKRLSDLIAPARQDELLEPERAFRFKAAAIGPATVRVDFIPAPGYYLYRERVKFSLKNSPGVQIRKVDLPAGKVKNDPSFGRMETWDKPVQATLTLERPAGARAITLAASYQGCNEPTGVCYPPIDSEVTLNLP